MKDKIRLFISSGIILIVVILVLLFLSHSRKMKFLESNGINCELTYSGYAIEIHRHSKLDEKIISEIKKLRFICLLAIQYDEVSSSQLSDLLSMKSLRYVFLDINRFTGDDELIISNNSNIIEFSIWTDRISNDALLQIGKLSKLKNLNVGECSKEQKDRTISGRGLRAIETLKNLEYLSIVNILFNVDESLALKFPKLKNLNLYGIDSNYPFYDNIEVPSDCHIYITPYMTQYDSPTDELSKTFSTPENTDSNVETEQN